MQRPRHIRAVPHPFRPAAQAVVDAVTRPEDLQLLIDLLAPKIPKLLRVVPDGE